MASESHQRHLANILGSSLPADERMSLGKLSPKEVSAWVDVRVQEYQSRIKELEAHIITFYSLRNTQASIHTLPSELLVTILAQACCNRRDLRIALVCRHWRELTLSTPQFWSNVLGSEPLCFWGSLAAEENFVRTALFRSGSLPVRLHIAFEFKTAWKLLSAHGSERIAALTVQVETDGQIKALVRALSSGSLQTLRTLSATCQYEFKTRLSLDARGLPSLRELSIDGVFLTSTSTVSTIEDLTVSGPVRKPWNDLALSLRRCTALRVLNLYEATPFEWDQEAVSLELDTVNLPQLRTFVLRDRPDRIHKVLCDLSIPSSASMSIFMSSVNSPRKYAFNDAIPFNYMRRLCEDSSIDRLYLEYPSDDWQPTTVRCYAGAQERFNMAATGYAYGADGFQRFLDPLFAACAENQPLSTLTIDISPSGAGSSDATLWGVLLQRLPQLSRLELLGRTPSAYKQHFATTFLDVCSDRSNGLTLAWVVVLDEEGLGGGVVSELEGLATTLEGSRKCSRLELYGKTPCSPGRKSSSGGCLADIPTDPEMLKTLAAPILLRLSGLSEVLTVN